MEAPFLSLFAYLATFESTFISNALQQMPSSFGFPVQFRSIILNEFVTLDILSLVQGFHGFRAVEVYVAEPRCQFFLWSEERRAAHELIKKRTKISILMRMQVDWFARSIEYYLLPPWPP